MPPRKTATAASAVQSTTSMNPSEINGGTSVSVGAATTSIQPDADMSDPPPATDIFQGDIISDTLDICTQVDDLISSVQEFDGTDARNESLQRAIKATKDDLIRIIKWHGELGEYLIRARDATTAVMTVAAEKIAAHQSLSKARLNMPKRS